MASSALLEWERQNRSWWRRMVDDIAAGAWIPATLVIASTAGAFTLGHRTGSEPVAAPPSVAELQTDLDAARVALTARQGELELLRLEMTRLQAVMDYSKRYRIPADLSASIYDIALAEGIDPELAYRLVNVESRFTPRAVSPVGAVGLAQLMPRTAFELEPGLRYSDLFDRETNLRLGFRYLRQMLQRYDGDLRLALLAYNRGPGTVDKVRREGGDPANGYARAVLGGH